MDSKAKSLSKSGKQRKVAKNKLTHSEVLLNKSQQLAHIGSLEHNVETRKEIWSNEMFRIFGVKLNSIEPSHEVLLSFIHPEDIGFVKHNIVQGRRELRDMSFYTRIIRKDGTIRHVYFESKYEFDRQGKPLTIQGIIHDITEKVLADKAKDFDSKNLSALINNTNDLMWSVDLNFNLITSNHAFDNTIENMIGRKIEFGSTVFPLEFDETQLARFKKFYERAFAGETFTELECTDNNWSEISFHPINDENKVMGTACYSRDITDRKKAEEEILQKNMQLTKLTSHLQSVREEERSIISREIHDELGQQLTVLKMDIDWIKHKHDMDDEEVILKLNGMLTRSDSILNTIRRISSNLRPAIIDDLGLIAALEWKCNDYEKTIGIPCLFGSSIIERDFAKNFSINVYRILQEALTNISRHAKAKSVTVSLSESKDELCLEIADDGKGIDIVSADKKQTLGIIGMKERATLLGGKLSMEGKKNKGTHIKLTLPISNEYINS